MSSTDVTPGVADPAADVETTTTTTATEQTVTDAPAGGDAGDGAKPDTGESAGESLPGLDKLLESDDGDDVSGEPDAGEGDDASVEGDDDGDDSEPEPIEYEFEAPEGVELRQPVIEAYKDALQKHRVDPAVAQDLLQAMLPTITADLEAQVQEQVTRERTAWEAEFEARHPGKVDEVRRLAGVALDKLVATKVVSPAFRDGVRNGALAANPDMQTLLAVFGARLSNDRPPKNGGQTPSKPMTAEGAVEARAKKYLDAQRGG
jgi:hypothetical protein